MNILSTITEIGILETLRVVSQNGDCAEKVAAFLPPVDSQYVESRIEFLSNAIVSTSKNSLFMMLPEIALLERLAQVNWGGTAILAIPYDMNAESRERIYANIPEGIHTAFVNEGAYPDSFRPDNGVITCTGIVPNDYRQYIIPSSCRMMSLYKVFQGERILLSCFPQRTKVPEIGWSYTETDFFNYIIEEVQYEGVNT